MEDDADEAEVRLWEQLIQFVRRSLAWQLFIKIALVLGGGAIAGIAQLPIGLSEAVKARAGSTGILLALIGGVLLVLAEFDQPKIMEEARKALRQWRAAITSHEKVALERQRLDHELHVANQLAVTFDGLIVLLERSLALPSASLHERLNRFLAPAAPGLINVMGLGTDLDWTLSIFCRQKMGREYHMVRVASNWSDRDEEQRDTRSWRRGKGWTGEAWRRGEENPTDPDVVERDATSVEAQRRYDTDGQAEAKDLAHYRSIASVPFSDRRTGKAVGVVTATSSRVGAFDVAAGTAGRRNLDTVKSFALLAALIVGVQSDS